LELVSEDGRHHIPKTNGLITMPNQTTLRFTTKFMEQFGPAVDVHVQTHHAEISTSDSINLPTHLHEALVLYVSGLYLSHMGGEEHTAKGDTYYGLYLQMLGVDDMNNTSGTSEVHDEDVRFQDRGFI